MNAMPSKKNIVDQFLSCLPSKSPGKLDFHFMGFNFDLRENKWIKEKELDESYMPDELLPPVKNRAANSTHRLSRMELQRASTLLKRFVEKRLEEDLGLVKHATPIVLLAGTGVNDDLDGSKSKSPIKFNIPNEDIPRGLATQIIKPTKKNEVHCEIVQSLANWKRLMLDHLGCEVGEGIYCESPSIRKGYKGDTTHSAVVDQYEFEVRINESDRTIEKLKSFVTILWKIITDAEDYILSLYPSILLSGHPTSAHRLPREIMFVTAQEVHDMFPNLGVHEKENAIVDKYVAVFIIGMGWPMSDGSEPAEIRSPSYDDWNLNGDIIVKHPLTEYRHELSSMGIRVDTKSLLKQLTSRGMEKEANLSFQKAILDEMIPFSFGGGLGISRLLMLLLRTGHIGEVHVGVWHDDHYDQAALAGIDLIPDRITRTFYRKFNDNEIAHLKNEAEKRMAKEEEKERTLVSIQVRPASAETEMSIVWQKIKSDKTEAGLKWEETCHLVDIGYGIQELFMTLTMGNKNSLDEIIDSIEKMDDVQSVEVVSMTKIPDVFTDEYIARIKREAVMRRAEKDAKDSTFVNIAVRPMTVRTNLEVLWSKITGTILPRGLKWQEKCHVTDVAFEIKELDMTFVAGCGDPAENFELSERVFEQIEEMEEVQSVEVKVMTVA